MDGFKPTKQEKTIISIRIDTQLLKDIDSLSAKDKLSRNEFVNQCIVFALKHYNENPLK